MTRDAIAKRDLDHQVNTVLGFEEKTARGLDGYPIGLPHFSTDMNAAMRVVAEMRRRGYEFALIADDQGEAETYAAAFDRAHGNIGETTYLHGERHESPATAICLAALATINLYRLRD